MSIFVSHASRDNTIPLYEVLLADLRRRSRQEIWVDSELSGGQLWWDEICKQIRDCSLFLVVVTPRLNKSEACRLELGYATALRKPVLPVKITAVSDWQLPAMVAPLQVLDFTQRQAAGEPGLDCAMNLIGAVTQMSKDAELSPDPLPEQPRIPDSYLSDLQRFLQAPELTLNDQEQFLINVRVHLEDEDKNPDELVGAISAFLARPDVTYRIHTELDRCLAQLVGATEPDRAPEAPVLIAEPEPEQPSVPAARQPSASELAVVVDPPADPSDDAVQSSQRTGQRTQRFPAPGVDVRRLADNVRGWFESQRLETQIREDSDHVLVQCRSFSFARKVGAGAALSVVLSIENDQLVVEIGGGKWADKVAAAGVGAVLLPAALIPAAVGGYKQATLPRRTLTYIENMIPRCTG
jgi:hypothetical protein